MSQKRLLRRLHLLAFCAFLASALRLTCGQRYAERNVLPAPSPAVDTSHDEYNYDDYDYEGKDANPYGSFFDLDEPADVYKWTVDQYPHPVNTPKFCHRFQPSHICDPDLVLEKSQADLLDEYIRKLYRETPCICDTCEGGDNEGGIVVGIALLKYLHHPYHMHHAKVIRNFAESLRSKWKLGRCDNDILIVVATTDRLSYTDVGKATSNYLSIHEAHRIFLENKSKFTAFNFSEGLMDILRGYHRATRGMQRREMDGQGDVDLFAVAGTIVGSVLLLGVILFLGFVIYRRCRNRKEADDNTDAKMPGTGRGTTVSHSWSKKDIKVLFGPERSAGPKRSSAKYQKCGTADENDLGTGNGSSTKDDQEMDFTLASPQDTSFPDQTRLTDVTSESADLEEDLNKATEGLVKTFPVTRANGHRVLVTDM